MLNRDIEKVMNCKEWIKIKFNSYESKGEILIKKDLYNLKEKTITRLLKFCYVEIIPDYILSIEEKIEFDEEINQLRRHIKRLEKSIEYAIKNDDLEYKNELLSNRDRAIKELNDRINQVRKEDSR